MNFKKSAILLIALSTFGTSFMANADGQRNVEQTKSFKHFIQDKQSTQPVVSDGSVFKEYKNNH